MGYKFQDELLRTSQEFARLLKGEGISAEIGEDSFRDYTVKMAISSAGKPYGNINIYYSPRKKSYSFRMHELKDKSIAPKLEICWQRMFPVCDDAHSRVHQIYVDGSFLNDSAGYGAVILKNGQVFEEMSGPVSAAFTQDTRNIAGELVAAEKAIQWCQENSVKEVSIFYDYKGIEKWASGEWKTKNPLTRRYAEFVRDCGIDIQWHKVDSHTGNRWNERADELAKSGVAPSEPEEECSDLELEKKAKEFVTFLAAHGYKAELKGIYGSPGCAKILVLEADSDIGYVNIYCTKKEPFLPRYHELRDQSHRDKLDRLWREFHYGERWLLS